MADEQAEQLLDQNRQLLEKVSSLEAELQVQKDLVAALLKKLYGAKSEKLSTDPLLMASLEDEGKKPDAAGPEEEPAAESKPSKTNASRATHGPIHDWHSSRANTCLDRILIGDSENGELSFQGHLQSDGLQAYRTFRERHPHLEIIPASCLAHIRRKFIEAQNDHSKYTAWILHQIGKIYGIESQLRASRAGPLERQRQRWLQTGRHYGHLGKLFKHLQLKRRILPKSQLGKALNYTLDQRKQLEPCFHDGQIEFDNNHTENAIRPIKLGAKNWLFIGRDETGWRSAIIYTMVEQVRRHGHDPFAYFEWVFEKLMHNPAEEDLPSLLPTSWLEVQDTSESLPQNAA